MTQSESRPKRLRRNTLTKARIIEATLAILDTAGRDALTFTRLGAQLGASSTAVYRYFASRDDILIAIADELDRQSLDGYTPSEDWRESLLDLAIRAWTTAEQHPAAAVNSLFILTGGMNELRAVDAVLEALDKAGHHGRAAVLYYQAFANLVLAMSAANASRLLMDTTGSATTIQEYHPADPRLYPYVEAVKSDLRKIDQREVFSNQVAFMIEAIGRGLLPPG